MQGTEIELSPTFWVVVVIGGVCTFGMILPFLWWYARRYPKVIDPEGVTLRDGRRFAWNQLESVNRVSVRQSGIQTVTDALHLQFPGLLIGYNPVLFVNGRQHHAMMRGYIAAANNLPPS